MKKHVLKFMVINILILISLSGCNNAVQDVSTEEAYNTFENTHAIMLDFFKPNNFILISESNKIMMSHSFPKDIKIDTRESDSIDDNIKQPSKYELFFTDIEQKMLIKLTTIYTPNSYNEGIVYYQVISPTDNINISEKYQGISRPIIVETLTCFGNYSILLNTILVEGTNKEPEDLTMMTIDTHWNFFKELEEFLLSEITS